jgi:AcrR family transcriptional regulator
MSPRPYHSPVREAAAGDTHARIIAAAGSLLGGPQGSEGFSLEAVAKKAGVSRLTVYKQFGSRRALLEEVFDVIAARHDFDGLAKAMADPDPFRGLQRVVAFFCDFWSSDTPALVRLHSAGASDPDLDASVRERNERRRCLLAALVRRMGGGRRPDSRPLSKPLRDLVDVLFALTGVYVFDQLASGGRSAEAASRLIQAACDDAVRRAGLGQD